MISKYLDFIRKSEYAKGFFLILSSKALIIVITFISTPLIARIYSPEDYGIYAILNSIILNLVLITNLTLPSGIIVFKNSKLKASISGIIGYSLYSNLFFLVVGLLLLLNTHLKTQFSAIIGFDFSFGHLVVIIFISVIITITEVFANLNIKEKRFKRNVTVNVTETISNKISSVLIGVFAYNKFGLIQADIIGKIVNMLYQLQKVKFNISFLKLTYFKKLKTIKKTIRNNHLYPKYNLPTNLLNRFSSQIIIWFFAIYFTNEQIGYFTMSTSLVGIPLLLFSNAISPLITKKLSEERENQFEGNTLYRLVLQMILLSFLIYAVLYFITPFFVEYYLGEKWIESIIYIKILCIPFGLTLISNSISGAFIVYERQKGNLVFKLISFIILLVGITLMAKTTMSFVQLVMLYAFVISFEQILKTFYILRKAEHV